MLKYKELVRRYRNHPTTQGLNEAEQRQLAQRAYQAQRATDHEGGDDTPEGDRERLAQIIDLQRSVS